MTCAWNQHCSPSQVKHSCRYATANTEDGGRLDISVQGFWDNRYQRAFFDVTVFNPNAQTYRKLQLASVYRKQEREKQRTYEQRMREVELGTFTPLVFLTSGGMAKSASVAYKRLASLLARKRDQPYSLVIAWLRCHLSFSLLKSVITCLRGARSSSGHVAHNGPVDLVVSEGQVHFENFELNCHFHTVFFQILSLLRKKKKKKKFNICFSVHNSVNTKRSKLCCSRSEG